MWNVWGKREIYIGFWWTNLKGMNHSGDIRVDRGIILTL
jgi:hypothetical protein